VPVVFTIHNLAFQGQFPSWLFPLLGLPTDAFAMAGLEYHGGVGLLKAGLWFADRITTVSPSYATEIRTAEGGMGLDGLLRGRGGDVSGILNGIDTVEWDPETDAHLAARFSAEDVGLRGQNKAALQRRFGLEERADAPLFGFVGRLAWQKGVDLILESLPWLLGSGAQLMLLGSGDAQLEERCQGAAAANGGRIGTVIGFDEGLARLIYGGADSVLVPSRFEPCGLAQLCALRYGAPPLVARVGGLADTVIDANEAAVASGSGTGVQFAPVQVEMLGAAVQRMVALYRQPALWARLQGNAMRADVSWQRSAGRYAALFREIARA
jgi:starch synthase